VFTKNKKHVTLLRYWTTRYLLTLVVGLLLLGAGSVWWIKETTLENRLKLMEYMAVETADRVGQSNGFGGFDKRMEDRTRFFEMENQPLLSITDMEGNVLNTGPMHGGGGPRHLSRKIPAEIIANDDTIKRFTENGTDIYAVKAPITINQLQTGWVIVMQNAGELTDVDQEYRLLLILLVGLGLLGWVVIYLLTKRILKPIQDVALAAAQVREGDYDIKLEADQKELEIYELVTSFKEMTSRLTQLEQMRAELLAGVTHDLKTPVTSISGLVQAVRDGIVTGEERQEFMDITLKETQRLQSMISDLLDFNSLAAGAITIRPENCNLNKLVEDIGRQWQVTQNQPVNLQVIAPDDTVFAMTDPLRLQQILINLLNNSYQAIDDQGLISIILSERRIDVKDTGSGIPEEEHALVFERFYRGENKKLKVRGLGLGLPFSKMLARSLGANLILKESNPNGTTFSLMWDE
jgi:signal transduction histidine kinase